MAELTVDPASLSFTGQRGKPDYIKTLELTISDANATLAKVGGAAWLTIPATSVDGVAFDVVVNTRELPATATRTFTETIRASADGYDDTDVEVTLSVRPAGPAKRRR